MSLVNINGDSITAKYSGFNDYCFVPDDEPNRLDWGEWTYQQLIDNVYEPLRAEFPNYITRSSLGKDASNTYDIWQYTFDPGETEQTLYVQSGVHPYEEDSWIGLGRIMQIICHDWHRHEGLAYLRWSCKLLIVPVVNVWGVSQPRSSRTANNYNGVNLNRDAIALTQSESKSVTNFILQENTQRKISGMIDFHTTVNNTYGDYMLELHPDAPHYHMTMNVGRMLLYKNLGERNQEYLDKYGLGVNDTMLPWFGTVRDNTFEDFCYRQGIPSMTCEHSDYVWDNAESTGKCIKKSIECCLNHLLGLARAKYFVEK